MNTPQILTKLIKEIFHAANLDIVRYKNSPVLSLLGLKEISFRTIIDVGANKGQFAKMIFKHYPKANIYCFEPLPEPFNDLKIWAEKQQGRIVVYNIALGDKIGEVEMFAHVDHSPSSSLLRTTELGNDIYPFISKQKRTIVQQSTLDSFFEQQGEELFPELLIKLDVQGYEDRVIKCGRMLFAKASACIVEVSLDALYEGQAKFKELLLILDEMGFQYKGNLGQVYAEDGHCVYLDAVFINSN